MSTDDELSRIRVGAMSLMAPQFEGRRFDGLHGRMWQWVGDGSPLISFTVAVRRGTRLISPPATSGHLLWELDRHRAVMTDATEVQSLETDDIDGATAVAAGSVEGIRTGVRIHNRVLVTCDGNDQYVLHAVVTNGEPGRELASALLRDVRFEGSGDVG